MVLEKTLDSPLDCKEIQPVNPKGNQSWIFIGRNDAEAEVPIKKAGGEGDDRGWDDEMVEWLDGITDSMDMSLSKLLDGQGLLEYCSPWGRKELDTTERLN